MLPRLQVGRRSSGPVQDSLPRLQEDTVAVRELATEPVQNLVERISRLRRLGEEHGLLHRRVSEQALLPQYDVRRDGRQDAVEHWDVLLGNKHANLLPRDGVRERQDNVISDDHWDAAKHHRLHQPGTPWSPAQRAQAED
jgi:hypothetical protein